MVDINDIPTWVRKGLEATTYVDNYNVSEEELAEIHAVWEMVSEFGDGDHLNLLGCSTSGASVSLMGTSCEDEKYLIWDGFYFAITKACIYLTFADDDNDTERLCKAFAYNLLKACSSRLLRNYPLQSFVLMQLPILFFSDKNDNDDDALKFKFSMSKWGQRAGEVCSIIRKFVLYHEIGHYFYSSPGLNTAFRDSIDEKVGHAKKLIRMSEKRRNDAILETPETSRRSSEFPNLQTYQNFGLFNDRSTLLQDVLRSNSSKEEIWCDLFAIERLIVHQLALKKGFSDIYLSLMLSYYIESILHGVTLCYSRSPFYNLSRMGKETDGVDVDFRELRARMEMRTTLLQAIALQFNPEWGVSEFKENVFYDARKFMDRFTKLEKYISLSRLVMRPMMKKWEKYFSQQTHEEKEAIYAWHRKRLGWHIEDDSNLLQNQNNQAKPPATEEE